MDNFMDKLAKRFNAGELIQANGEAEARENQRLREQMNEYDKVIQEVRRLNLKTIEVSEQVSQMAACSIEQIESYQVPVSEDDFKEDYADEFAVVKEELAQLQGKLAELAQVFGGMEQRIVQSCASSDDQDEFISLSRKVDEAAAETRRQMEVSASETRKKFDDTAYRLEAALSQAESSIAQLEMAMNQVGATVSRVELGNDTNQKAVEGAIRNLEMVLAEKEKDDSQEQDSAKQIKEMIVNVRLYLDEVQKHIEDYMHKESVKVYRNVQAAMNEQLSMKTRDLNDHMDHLEKEIQKNKGLKALVLVAVVLSGASFAIQVLQVLGIF
jgi:hypothetical protein